LFTLPRAVNNSGAIVGQYIDASGLTHGFLYRNGTFTTIDAPGAGTNPARGLVCGFFNPEGTLATGISASGVIVGDICTDTGLSGWVLSNGKFSSLNDPNAGPLGTYVGASSENGRLVGGAYFDAGGLQHGFVATLTP
jgi:probable HAF family extracellular repeat protein